MKVKGIISWKDKEGSLQTQKYFKLLHHELNQIVKNQTVKECKALRRGVQGKGPSMKPKTKITKIYLNTFFTYYFYYSFFCWRKKQCLIASLSLFLRRRRRRCRSDQQEDEEEEGAAVFKAKGSAGQRSPTKTSPADNFCCPPLSLLHIQRVCRFLTAI